MKNLKHITDISDIHAGMLYQLSDIMQTIIIRVDEVVDDNMLGEMLFFSKTFSSNNINMNCNVISEFLKDDMEFNNAQYEFLEIGPSNDYPEYFL
jgi:hypothetical protein